jgi:hypothetical protein
MPRFSLRTLILVMLLGGPMLAGAWWAWGKRSELAGPVSVLAVLAFCVCLEIAAADAIHRFATTDDPEEHSALWRMVVRIAQTVTMGAILLAILLAVSGLVGVRQ